MYISVLPTSNYLDPYGQAKYCCLWSNWIKQQPYAGLCHCCPSLNILWNYWLLWRKMGCHRRALSCQEQRAALHWESRLMRLTYTVWTAAVLIRQHRRSAATVTVVLCIVFSSIQLKRIQNFGKFTLPKQVLNNTLKLYIHCCVTNSKNC